MVWHASAGLGRFNAVGGVMDKKPVEPVTVKRRGHGHVAIDAMGDVIGWSHEAAAAFAASIQARYGVDVVREPDNGL
jgi:hypothetical protein